MSGLFSTLDASVKAITAHSRALEISGKNLANVNNPDYARQRVIFGDRGTVMTPQGAQSLGFEALGVEQLRDALLDQQVMREVSRTAELSAEQAGYQRAQAGLGQSIDRTQSAGSSGAATTTGLAAALDDFFNAFGSLAASPTDVGERQTLVQRAAILTDRFQLADQRLDQVQADLDSQINTDVASTNRLLTAVADLNSQIARMEVNAPGTAVDLRDQRQARLEELAAKMTISTAETANGSITVSARDGAGATVQLVNQSAVLGTVMFNGTQVTAGSPATVIALGAGSIQGSLTARDGAVQTLRDNLDRLAAQIVTSVNAAYNPTGATGNFFDPAGIAAGTIRVATGLTATTLKASDGGAPGDNTIAVAVAALAEHTFSAAGGDSIDGRFSGFLANTVSSLGQSLSSANAEVQDQQNIEKLVRNQRDSLSGVSLDEEMADMMKFQRAFQASSRVFSIVDELLNLVVNRLGSG